MPGIVDSIIEACGSDMDSEFLAASREKVSRYLETLSAMGETDRRRLAAYGRAYLDELHHPDRRYTGC
jgi:hypothetical protein